MSPDHRSILQVDYVHHPVHTLAADEVLYLDREFLSASYDREVSRRPEAPSLRMRERAWWLDNGCRLRGVPLTLFVTDEGRRYEVPQRCCIELPPGDLVVHVWSRNYRVRLVHDAASAEPSPASPDGERTEVGLPDAIERVRKLFHDHLQHKIALVALYREYLTPGLRAPQALSRQNASLCMGRKTPSEVDAALQYVQQAIWGGSGHSDDVPDFLIGRCLLTQSDLGLVKHTEKCGHLPRHPAAPPPAPPMPPPRAG